MKRKKWIACLTGCCLGILLSCSSISCFVSAFDFPTVDMKTVYLWCVAMAICWSLCYTWKLQLIPVCAFSFLAGFLWYGGSLEQSAEALLYQISVYYDGAYNCGTLCWSGTFPAKGDVTMVLCAAATWITLPVCRTVCARHSAWLAVAVTVIPLAACMVVTDLVPSLTWLGMLLAGEVLLILPNTLRRSDPVQGALLTALITLPVVLAVTLLLWAVPKDQYRGQSRADTIADTLLQWLPSMEQLEDTVGSAISGAMETDSVDLSAIGRRNNARIILMQVTGTAPGTIYLRGQHLDRYDGTSWYTGDLEDNTGWLPETNLLQPIDTLEITTRYTMPTLYVPYYAAEPGQDWSGKRMENTEKLKSYSYVRRQLMAGWQGFQENGETVAEALIQLPDRTRAWAQTLLADIISQEQRTTEKAEAIASFVRSSAKYNVEVDSMPGWETDFVRWFIEDCDEGYCVHFATSAVVLLRAAGIPARYVTGYMTTLGSDGKATVRLDDGHAWAEYYVSGVGWVILEATPAAQTQSSQPQTQSEETTAPTVTVTEPSPSQTAPAETLPQKPQEPANPQQPQKETKWLQTGWKVLAVTGSLVGLAWLQWRIRLTLRLRRLQRGTANARAIAMWREVVYLARLLSEQPRSELFAIAQKAKFSNHKLTAEELQPLDAYIQQAWTQLQRKPLYLRLIYRIILAVF